MTATEMKIGEARASELRPQGEQPGKYWWTLEESDVVNSCAKGQGSVKNNEDTIQNLLNSAAQIRNGSY